MKTTCILLLAFLIWLPSNVGSQTIDNIEKQLQPPRNGENVNASGGDEWFWIELLFEIGYYPTVGLLFGFENEPSPGDIEFSDFPYQDGQAGLYRPLFDLGKDIRTQALFHFQNNEDNLYGGFFQVKFYPTRFLALDVNRLQLFEALESGGSDHFSITNFNVQYNRIRHPKFHLWWGGGLMLLDGQALYGSPSASMGFTWYFKKPLSLYADTQFGWPNGVYSRQHQARVQVHLDRFMVYCGYQGTRVGNVRIRNWAIGSGIWF